MFSGRLLRHSRWFSQQSQQQAVKVSKKSGKSSAAVKSPSSSEAYKKMLDAEISSLLKLTSSQQDRVRAELQQNLDILLRERRELEGTDGSSHSGVSLDVAMSLDKNVMPRGDRQLVKPFDMMSNRDFRKHQGPELLKDAAKYYQLFNDALPLSYYDQISNEGFGNLMVSFSREHVWRGNLLNPDVSFESESKQARKPDIKFSVDGSSGQESKLFSLLCLDADTPLMKAKTMITTPMWIRSNINVSQDGQLNCDGSGEDVVDYVPQHPAKGTGSHRYIWLLLEQSSRIESQELLRALDAEQWNMRSALSSEFAGSSFTGVRGMVFHRAMWTPAVTEMYQQGCVKLPQFIAEQNDIKVRGEDEGPMKTVVSDEPVYGKLIERSWRLVNRNLYKYAFK